MNGVYNFNYGWKFLLADEFPLQRAEEKCTDKNGRKFYETDYDDSDWRDVSLPFTYNDSDLFRQPGEDAGSNQKRTFSFFRKRFPAIENIGERKVFIEFEGIRQTCYLYVNGTLAGYIESGVQPFGFDLTDLVRDDSENVIAVATDSTSTRNMDLLGAETPNLPGAIPGHFYTSLTNIDAVPEENRGVYYFWNSNDFNPVVSGLSKNVHMHIKGRTYLTLPLYSNLRTAGVYIYPVFDGKKVTVVCEAEVRNERDRTVTCETVLNLYDREGKKVFTATSEKTAVPSAGDKYRKPELSVIPAGAYEKTDRGYRAKEESELETPVETFERDVTVVRCSGVFTKARLWELSDPYLYKAEISLFADGELVDTYELETGFRKTGYDSEKGFLLNDKKTWLTGYAQRSTNEWAAIGTAPDWLKDYDALLIRESNANHIRFMHVAACPADIRAYDRYGVIATMPAGDKERENFGRQWCQRLEAMRDVIIYFRNSPSIVFWEAGNNSINKEHMREMRLLKEKLDPHGGRFMGCRTINTEDVIVEAEYVGTMLNRHAARFQSERMPVTETEYLREESPRRVWDDYTPPFYDYRNKWLGPGGRKQKGFDSYDLNAEEFAIAAARGYSEFFNDRMGGASGKNLYSAAAALCWTDSAQHTRQSGSENGRMSGRVDPVRIKKQNFDVFSCMQSDVPCVRILGHWNYPPDTPENYRYEVKEFDGESYAYTGRYERRDPRGKTVYVVGSYGIKSVELFVNGRSKGVCDRPENTFVFPFPDVDITEQGSVEAVGKAYDGTTVSDRIETVGAEAGIRLSVHTGEQGFLSDGSDVAYVDVAVVDANDRVCPLSSKRIDFSISGNAVFLGGYNSGRFNGQGRNDSVIHEDHVFAECGVNRVFVRSTCKPGKVILTAKAEGLPSASVEITAVPCDISALSAHRPQRLERGSVKKIPKTEYDFSSIPEADEVKYKKSDKVTCKVLVNGQEPNTFGVLSIVEHESVFSPVIPIFTSMAKARPDVLSVEYDNGTLVLKSGGHTVVAKTGHTHLIADGEENLMGGQPFIGQNGAFMMEINAIAGYIQGVKAHYDEKIGVYRIEW